MNMIECVARAIARVSWQRDLADVPNGPGEEEYIDLNWQRHKAEAKAAIGGMLNPTEEMIDAGVNALHGSGEVKYAFDDMIIKALKDT